MAPADKTAERIARNDSVFRDANERLRQRAVDHGADPSRLPFICECADYRCTQVVLLDLDTYLRIRSKPRWFLIAPMHSDSANGMTEIVERHDDFAIVEKIGRAGEIAEQLAGGSDE